MFSILIGLFVDEYDSEIEKMKIAFELFDTHQDGKLSADELMMASHGLNVFQSVDELKSVLHECDLTGDGMIGF